MTSPCICKARAEEGDNSSGLDSSRVNFSRLRFYGRRQTRALRAGQREAMKRYLPGFTLSLKEEGKKPENLPGKFSRGFEQYWLEIGFGKGEHLFWRWQCDKELKIGFVGCEPFRDGVASFLSCFRDHAEQLPDNIKIFPDMAEKLLPRLEDSSFDRVFILFPDPWPKKRHHNRRLINPAFLDALARVMKEGAFLDMATDHADYRAVMMEELSAHPHFHSSALKKSPDHIETRYEEKARRAGREGRYFRFIKKEEKP